jgi:hypothetical protein
LAERYYNPFQGIDVSVPVEFREDFGRYCQTGAGGRALLGQSPFPRMVDLWFLAVCTAARLQLKPVDISKLETYKIIEGSIFSSDPWRVTALMLVAIAETGEVEIVGEPRRMMSIANGLAVAGLPRVLEMLKEGSDEPIWNLSEAIEQLLQAPAA